MDFDHIEFAMPVAIPRKQIKMDLKLRKRSGLEKDLGVLSSKVVVEVIGLNEVIQGA